MKITFGASYSIEEFGDALDRALQTLKLNGADGVAKVSVYLNPTQGKRTFVLTQPDDEQRAIEHLEYDPPVRAAFRPVHPNVRPAERPAD